VPVDERIARRFLVIQESLVRLRQLQGFEHDEFLADFRNVEAAKHLLQTSIEALIDVAVHILASLKEPLPDHHAEVFDALARRRVLPLARVETYRKMIGFRNRVVHLYDRVDDGRVWEVLQQDLPDFETFISEMVSFLES
jgi:uncharacterized protein YutE (UPF0331/DUF86 family)